MLECLVSKPCNHATAQTRPHGKVATNSPPYLRRGRVAALSMPHGFTSSGWGFIIGSTASKYGASSGGGRCRWGPQAVGLCDVSFAPFSQQAAPHTPELHGQRAQKKRTSEESHRPCTCEPRCHRGGAEWAGRQQVPERKRTKGGGHSSRGPTASAASGSQTSRNIPPAETQPPPLSVVAQSAGQPVLGIQGDHRNRAKLTLVLHVVLCMDRFAKVRENLHQGGLKLGRLLAMGHGTAASNSQTQHCMKRAIAAKKHA